MKSATLVRALRRLATRRGWFWSERPGKGSHVVVVLNGRRSVIPMHAGDIRPGTLRAILRQLDLADDDLEA